MMDFIVWGIGSSLLVMMILGIRRMFTGNVSYAVIYALWFVVLLRFLIPVNMIPSPFGVGTLLSKSMGTLANVQGMEKMAQRGAQRINIDASGYTGTAVIPGQQAGKTSAQERRKKQESSFQKSAVSSGQTVEKAESGIHAQNRLVQLKHRLGQMPWKKAAVMLWGTGTGLLLLCFFWSNICLNRRLTVSRRYWGKRGNIRIYTVSGWKSPCLYGVFRPVIYLPEHLTRVVRDEQGAVVPKDGQEQGMCRSQLNQMITHEYVHYLHKDHIWAVFRMLLTAVWWFDPFVWIAASVSKKDAELFCDETVIRLLGEQTRFEYGELLIRLAGERKWTDFRYSMMPMSRRGREMKRRILAISRSKRYSRWLQIPVVLAVCAAVLLTCGTQTGVVSNAQGKEKNQTAQKPAQAVLPAGSAIPGSGDWMMEIQKRLSDDTVQEDGRQTQSGVLASMQEEGVLVEIRRTGDDVVYDDDDVQTCERIFRKYVLLFTESVNTAKTGKLKQVMREGSQAYVQQCALAENYHQRGIREKAKQAEVDFAKIISSDAIQIYSREKIRVTYQDAPTRLVRQSYCYTCEKKDGVWRITGMDDAFTQKTDAETAAESSE